MDRWVVGGLVFTLSLCSAARAAEPSTPAWLPRGLLLATSLRQGAVVPEARLQWQLAFFERQEDTLGLMIEPAAGWAAARPAGLETSGGALAELRLYSLMVSLGYTSQQRSGLQWGFQLGTGPLWYRARFTGAPKAEESYLVALLDGRARLGYRFGPIGLGATVGYGDPYNYKRSSLSRPYLGGLQLGLYADWR